MAKRTKKRSTKDEGRDRRGPSRMFWSGTISFGLVTVPVQLYPAARSGGSGMRMLDEKGTPLVRRYYCPEHGNRQVKRDHIVRGYPVDDDEYVVVEEEELEAIAPKKSREIDLRRFVDLADVSRLYFNRAYYLTPAGQTNKAYRLLAAVMEASGRAGIATFVMRGREYLVAIISSRGILRAQTLRFVDEVRSPEAVELPEPGNVDKRRMGAFRKAIRQHAADHLALGELEDVEAAALRKLAGKKAKQDRDVVEVKEHDEAEEDGEDETASVDLLEVIREKLRKGDAARRRGRRRKESTDELDARSRDELYEMAKELDVSGRSSMNKKELVGAIRSLRRG